MFSTSIQSAPRMLVGHLPYVSRLASCLLAMPLDRPAAQFQVGRVVRLDRNESGHWVTRWMIV